MEKKRVRAIYSTSVRFMLQPENITVKLAVLVFIKYSIKKRNKLHYISSSPDRHDGGDVLRGQLHKTLH